MRLFFAAATAALVAATGSCTTAVKPAIVPVSADRASLAPLAGRWTGEYHGTQSGRSGSITFTLRPSGDSATGEVMMNENGTQNVVRPSDTPEAHRLHASSPQVLFIRFVAISNDEVYGKLEPYTAPDCDCVVSTGFTGQVRGDTVQGTFFTQWSTALEQSGVWRVVRRPVVESPR